MNRRKILISGAMALGAATVATLLPPGMRRGHAALPTVEQMMAEKSIGDPDAPVTIHTYESLSCSHCQSFHQNTLPELKRRYIDTGQVRMVFHEVLRNRRDLFAVMMARCTGDRYLAMTEMLYNAQQQWATVPGDRFVETLGQYARLGGLSEEDFNACMENQELANVLIERNTRQGEELNIRSTPTFIIGDERITGAQPIDVFAGVLDPMVEG